MATLRNLTDADVFCAVLHVMVPGGGFVEIDDGDAETVNVSSGVFTVDTAAAARKQAVRSGKVAEVGAAPIMEKRG